MTRPSKNTQEKTPVVQSSVCENVGAIGYLSHLEHAEIPSLENTQLAPQISPSDSPQQKTTEIYKKHGQYHVYIHTDEITPRWFLPANVVSFVQWLMSLKEDDVVFFYQTGKDKMVQEIVQSLVVIDTQCKAKKIFVVDHAVETPLVLFVCDEFVIEDTGAIQFSNCIPDDPKRSEQVFRPYLQRLYSRAVKKGLLTEDEVNSILNDNNIIFKTARELRPVA